MEQNKKLLLKLLKAEDETDVEKILETELNQRELQWWPFNGNESNFSTINNQQVDPIAALCEKPINSIDAVLTLKCRLAGIDPEGTLAPKSMLDAVDKFFKINEGDISNLSEKDRRNLSKEIRIIAEGSKECPNIFIVDFGEGQNPADFKNTLLSLHGRNKARVPFVQGKYGMGGTGVIPFCGKNKFQLVLSRKHPSLLKSDQKDLWGFTLIRRTPPNKLSTSDKHSWFECLVDSNVEVLIFEGEDLKILPYDEKIQYGCLIKLFNYDLSKASLITIDLWRDLNRRLFSPALPILMHENRTNHFTITKGKNDTKILIGNKYRIKKDDRNFVYKSIDVSANLKSFEDRDIEVVLFKDFDQHGEDLRKRQEWTTTEESVFLTINGQTHFTFPRYWLRKTHLDFLVDYMFIHIDCTEVSRSVTDDIFLGSRDRVRTNTDFRIFEEELIKVLANNELLLELNEEYKKRQLARIKPDNSITKKLVGDLISKNKILVNFFGAGVDVSTADLGDLKKAIRPQFTGAYIPTFLRILKQFQGSILVKEVRQNAPHAVVLLETDAQNDYFKRKEDTGKLTWSSDHPQTAKITSWYIYNGVIFLRVGLSNQTVGTESNFAIEITRPNMDPLAVQFKTKVVVPTSKTKRKKRKQKYKGISLPQLIVVKEKSGPENETWEDHKWSGTNIAKVEPGRVYVNMDCNDLKEFLVQCPKRLRALAETVYKTGIYLNSIVLDLELNKTQNGDKTPAFNLAIGVVSKTLLPLYLNPEIQKLANP